MSVLCRHHSNLSFNSEEEFSPKPQPLIAETERPFDLNEGMGTNLDYEKVCLDVGSGEDEIYMGRGH